MPFNDELKFEEALVSHLTKNCGWSEKVIKNPTEEDLIKNWASILFDNNKEKDVLNDCPLTDGEMRQILNQISSKTPFALNKFINGKTVSIKRDNKDDILHFEKVISLKIYDRTEIAGGKSKYQIVEQPIFSTSNPIYPKRRGDIMLLINGMPLFHIELKKTDVPITEAEIQIEKYMANNCFTGIFSLVQVFVCMNPEEAIYFSNPGQNGKFNKEFFFHWEDIDNNIINAWQDFASSFLYIPRAHEVIGYYTIADATDNILKVMRSYQIYAAEAIFNKVNKTEWTKKNQHGGYIWHTTGSGKTMTSFKAAELIASANLCDKVIFLIDRTELGEQTFDSYTNFSGSEIKVRDTDDTKELISRLINDDKVEDNRLIVTSIQKMSRIKEKGDVSKEELEKIKSKNIVFIIDECHRDQNGEMHSAIKNTFPDAIYFGFTGTPDFSEDPSEDGKADYGLTSRIFGDELHRYTITHGLRDRNVLSFDPYMVSTFKESEIREKVALKECDCVSAEEAFENENTRKIYMYYMNKGEKKCPMTEVEKHINSFQYSEPTNKHLVAVVKDIVEKWTIRSVGNKFHAILATSSIEEAIRYYSLFSESKLRVTAVFDPSDDNNNESIFKMKGITEILSDYNQRYNMSFTHANYALFKKDVCLRLAHKKIYENIKEEEKLDLVIVVDQLLTGFDSVFVNTLYLDKVLRGKNLIQAISRTNRIYNRNLKPHGTIVWYRYPYTMKKNLEDAIKEYSGENAIGIFVNKLGDNIENMNKVYTEIVNMFESSNIKNFEKIDENEAWQKKFSKRLSDLNRYLQAAKTQGFNFKQKRYVINTLDEYGKETNKTYECIINEIDYLKLVQRYKEMAITGGGGTRGDVKFDIDTYITETQTDTIDDEYIDSRFKLYIKNFENEDPEARKKAEKDLYNSFSSLSKEDQKYAKMIIQDIEEKNLIINDSSKTFRDYIIEYKCKANDNKIHDISVTFGLDEERLKKIILRKPNKSNLDEYSEFRDLKKTIDIEKTREYFSKKKKTEVLKSEAIIEAEAILRQFIIYNECDI